MEYIERIFYRKINPSDFKKLYDIDRPESGGGQTYLEAAGIENEKIVDFLSYAEKSVSPLKDESRFIYTFNAYVLGDAKKKSDFIEFAPRGGRNNYRISRQNMKYKHPAWSLENGFPEPFKNSNGDYTSEGDFEGIIDDLVIMIIRTSFKKHYAGFVNRHNMPQEWPQNIGLENIFKNDRRGVLDLEKHKIQFINAVDIPFAEYVESEYKQTHYISGENILYYGVPGTGKSYTIKKTYNTTDENSERVVFHPDYTYSDFIGQILPTTNGDKISYPFTPGPFTRILKKATQPENQDKPFYLIIEEINRGNAPAIFGEVFQLLDRVDKEDKEQDSSVIVGESSYGINNSDIAKEVYGDEAHPVKIPANLFILATMNTADQNVFTLDTAFKRRWKMKSVKNDLDGCGHAKTKICGRNVEWAEFAKKINALILECGEGNLSSEDNRLGAYFVKASELADPETFAEKVLMYLWNDAFKFDREKVFKTTYKSLEELIEAFEEDGFIVFDNSLDFDNTFVVNESIEDTPYVENNSDDNYSEDSLMMKIPELGSSVNWYSINNEKFTVSSFASVLSGVIEHLYSENPTIMQRLAERKYSFSRNNKIYMSTNKSDLVSKNIRTIPNTNIHYDLKMDVRMIIKFVYALIGEYNHSFDYFDYGE